MTHEFKIARLDKQGRVIKNSANETVYDTYVYDFNLLSVDRVLTARKLFHLSTKDYAQAPKQNDELEVLVKRESEKMAFAAILMKLNEDGIPEPYDPYQTSSKFLGQITGEENFNKLMECQGDFFHKAGLQSPELMTQSLDIMMQSLNIMKEFKNLEGAMGGDMQSIMKTILEAAMPSSSTKPETSFIESIIPQSTTKKKPETR
jgi:hypothetical protein